MANIDTAGMEVASLNEEQLNCLITAEKEINQAPGKQEIYLLAVQK
ncbi:hypothetical protein SPSYN_02045 [Sporotomaculum syntrophicum]|uniref:Uncharacterized protein n=1 Tax=Sporotomaculum syntrophicum TaxID=182264 RepID=A0A9D2WPR5_9FIRM|nr:hypothetical protein [Sporotomaculum syntrophicum]KAF1084875.1 hypothetical protein SPSYN_02045 [Sporotomaculum syntrophicum]